MSIGVKLPKLTINGIDGFKSGKWVLNANAVAVDDETLVLNATADYQTSYLNIDILPNQPIFVSFEGGGYVAIDSYNSTGVFISQILSWGLSGRSVVTPSNTKSIRVWFSNKTNRGQFTFKNPILNLGSIPAPYEKKRGERMVLPVPKKNLLFGVPNTNSSRVNVMSDYDFILNANYPAYEVSVKRYTNYSFSWDTLSTSQYSVQDVLSNSILPYGSGFRTFNTGSNSVIRIWFMGVGTRIKNPQLEQGTTATPYEAYAVQVNKKPTKLIQNAKQQKTRKRMLEPKR